MAIALIFVFNCSMAVAQTNLIKTNPLGEPLIDGVVGGETNFGKLFHGVSDTNLLSKSDPEIDKIVEANKRVISGEVIRKFYYEPAADGRGATGVSGLLVQVHFKDGNEQIVFLDMAVYEDGATNGDWITNQEVYLAGTYTFNALIGEETVHRLTCSKEVATVYYVVKAAVAQDTKDEFTNQDETNP